MAATLGLPGAVTASPEICAADAAKTIPWPDVLRSTRRYRTRPTAREVGDAAIGLQIRKKSYIIRAHFRFGLLGTRASAWKIRLAL